MFLLLPFLLGAGGSSYWWWSSQKKQQQPSLWKDLLDILKPIVLIVILLLFIRWLYVKSSPTPAAAPTAPTS